MFVFWPVYSGERFRASWPSCLHVRIYFRRGDVKFFLDPLKDVKTVKKFGSLRSSLYKGKRVRMTMDISKCSGGKVKHVTVGAEIRSEF